MSHATVEEFQHEFGRYKALAGREPVVVLDGGQPAYVWLSMGEYRRLKGLDRTAVRSANMPAATLALLDRQQISDECRAFDHEAD